MALRVLLADESSTIKKVIQLSLQDFNVEVKSVTIGLDVLSVAKTFKPDIVLADVLLAKRSGYEVCHDLKNDPETNNIPVVLMWSGFMEIDDQKARICGADRRLEKPFDAQALRQMVQELVSRTQSNPVSAFLKFPKLPAFEETPRQPAPAAPTIPGPAAMTASPGTSTIPEIKIPNQIPVPQDTEDEGLVIDDAEIEAADEWVQQPIATKPATPSSGISFPISNEPPGKEDEFTEFPLTQPTPKASPSRQQPISTPTQTARPQTSPSGGGIPMQGLSEDILREEIQKWLAQNLPEIAERLIREEINRLLQESENTIQSP